MLPLWRSMLFVPATAARFVEKAAGRGADAIILDLEDAVAPSAKQAARDALTAAVPVVGAAGADVLVRINRPLRLAIADLDAAVRPGVMGLMLPKAESAEHVRLLSETVAEIERERGLPEGGIVFTVLIETARGYMNAREIAAADPRMRGISVGGEDFAAELGMASVSADALVGYLQHILVAAREAGIMPLGYPGSIANFSDLAAYETDIDRARGLGFEGGSAIHPAQVPILNRGFGPKDTEVALAERIVEAYDAALARGEGAIQIDGKMVDVPVADRARRILSLRDRIASRSL